MTLLPPPLALLLPFVFVLYLISLPQVLLSAKGLNGQLLDMLSITACGSSFRRTSPSNKGMNGRRVLPFGSGTRRVQILIMLPLPVRVSVLTSLHRSSGLSTGPTENEIRATLAEEEEENAASGSPTLHRITPSSMMAELLEIEELQ